MGCFKEDGCTYSYKKCETSRAGCLYFEITCEYDDDPCTRIKSVRSIGECGGCDRKPLEKLITPYWIVIDSEGRTELVAIESIKEVDVINEEMVLLATAFRNAFGWMSKISSPTKSRFKAIALE